jgi:hypothetical protein
MMQSVAVVDANATTVTVWHVSIGAEAPGTSRTCGAWVLNDDPHKVELLTQDRLVVATPAGAEALRSVATKPARMAGFDRDRQHCHCRTGSAPSHLRRTAYITEENPRHSPLATHPVRGRPRRTRPEPKAQMTLLRWPSGWHVFSSSSPPRGRTSSVNVQCGTI